MILWNALTLTALLIALGLAARFAAGEAILRSVDQSLEDRTRPPHHGPPRHGPSPGQGSPSRPFGPGPPPGQDGTGQDGTGGRGPDGPPPDESADPARPRFFDARGQPLHRGGGTAWDSAALGLARQGQTVFTTVSVGGLPLRVLSQPGPSGIVIQAAYPLADVDRAVAGLDRALLLLIPVALLAAGPAARC